VVDALVYKTQISKKISKTFTYIFADLQNNQLKFQQKVILLNSVIIILVYYGSMATTVRAK
jgi:hypothetical protein